MNIKPLLSILLTIGLSMPLAAQSGSFLEVNPDARSQAMGGITATQLASAFSFWNNTSNTILYKEKWQAGVSYGKWQPVGANVISVGGYGKVNKFMAVSAGVKYYTYTFDVSDAFGAVSSASPKDISAGVGLAFKIFEGFAVSGNISWYCSSLGVEGTSTASGVTADFGATYNLKKMRFGITASNIGSKINYGGVNSWKLPANAKLGVGGTLGSENHSVTLDGQAGLLFEGSSFFASAGVEYTIYRLVSIRGGYHYGDETKFLPSYASAGLGVKTKWFKIDGAYLFPSADSPLKNTFIATLSVAF